MTDKPTTPESEQGEVYRIAREEEQPLTVYIKRKTSDDHDWYRIQSWPVVFLGFEEFDLRVHRLIDWLDGWAVSEATTGMAIVKDDNFAASPDTACDRVAWHIVKKQITPENLREKIAKGKERLKALGLCVRSESAAIVPTKEMIEAGRVAIMGMLEPKRAVMPKPSIAELEAILNADGDGRNINIEPDGSVTELTPRTTTASEVAKTAYEAMVAAAPGKTK